MRKSVPSSGFPDTKSEKSYNASGKSRTPWGSRIEEALGPRSQAWLARAAGITPSTLGDLLSKSEMKAGVALRIAEALEVPVEWLVTGAEERRSIAPGSALMPADEADWVIVPHYRLSEFSEVGKPAPIATVPIRRDWLNRTIYTSTNLFITELPAHQIEGLGEEGDPILCRDADHHSDEGVYLYFWDGVPIVRRFIIPRPGRLAEAQPRWHFEPEDPAGLRIAARVLGNMRVRPL
jgi:transcriptional regulator with XRE-family HTH domain